VVVLTVLSRQYLAMGREPGVAGVAEGFAAKAAYLRARLEERLGRLMAGLGGGGGGVVRFATRVGR
jgi:hypothetical protein